LKHPVFEENESVVEYEEKSEYYCNEYKSYEEDYHFTSI
jgi:hypothetical protein